MDKRTIVGIESCRPSSDDLQGAELRDVARAVEQDPQAQIFYRRAQDWDSAIRGAIEQVPVPAGLAERIVGRLQMGGATVTAQALSEQAPSDQASSTVPPVRRWRRRSVGLAGAIAASLLLTAACVWWMQPRATNSIESMADVWMQQLSSNWQSMGEVPAAYRIPNAVTAVPIGWQRLNLSAARGVAYRLRVNAGDATLFVLKLSRRDVRLPAAPPVQPQSTTGGQAVGYWERDGLVYVLVVPGDERTYRSLVSTSPVPVA